LQFNPLRVSFQSVLKSDSYHLTETVKSRVFIRLKLRCKNNDSIDFELNSN